MGGWSLQGRVVLITGGPRDIGALMERDLLAAAPGMERAFEQELATRGVEGASVSDRVAGQLARHHEQVPA